ncbi:MAG: hypothetical protein ABSF22_03050 [Bryobacteraceae bacterium]
MQHLRGQFGPFPIAGGLEQQLGGDPSPALGGTQIMHGRLQEVLNLIGLANVRMGFL